jgi:hypothetical protein
MKSASSLSEMRSPYAFRGNGFRLNMNSPMNGNLGAGLGIGSSLGIYDNAYPTGSPKPAILRRKLLPNEGILLLEVEDQLPVDSFSGTMGSIGNGLNGAFDNGNVGAFGMNRQFGLGPLQSVAGRNGFNRPKFSVQLNSELKAGDSMMQPVFSRRMMQPHLTEKNLDGFAELSKDPHRNGANGSTVARLRNSPIIMPREPSKMLSLASS